MKILIYQIFLFTVLRTVLIGQTIPPTEPPRCFQLPLVPSSNQWNWEKQRRLSENAPNNAYTDWWKMVQITTSGQLRPREELLPFIKTDQPNLLGVYISNPDFQQALAKADMKIESGWELIRHDFGLAQGSQTVDPGKENPFIVFYNKYTSVLRVFVLVTQLYDEIGNGNGDNKGVILRLKYFPNLEAKYLPSVMAAYESPLKAVDFTLGTASNNGQVKIGMNVANHGLSFEPSWYFADFPITYDPCVCNYGSNLGITLTINSITNLNLSFNGTISNDQLLGGSGQVVNAGNSDVFGSLLDPVTNGLNDFSGFLKVLKDGGSAFSNLEASLDKSYPNGTIFTKYKSDFSIGKSLTAGYDKLAWIKDVNPVISSVTSYIDFLSGKSNLDVQVAQAMPLTIKDMNVSLTGGGTAQTSSAKSTILFSTPGAPIVSGSSAQPYYNNIMGVASLLRTPKAIISSFADAIPFHTYTVNHNGFNDTHNYKARKHQVELVEPLQLVVNPKIVDVNKIDLKATLIIENTLDVKDEDKPELNLYSFPAEESAEALTEPLNNSNLYSEGFSKGSIQIGGVVNTKTYPSYRTAFYPTTLLHHVRAKTMTMEVERNHWEFFGGQWNLQNTVYNQIFAPKVYVKIVGTIGFINDLDNKNELAFIAKYPVTISQTIIKPGSGASFYGFAENVQDFQEYITFSDLTQLDAYPINQAGEIEVWALSVIEILTPVSSYNGHPVRFIAPEIKVKAGVTIDPNYVVLESKAEYPVFVGEHSQLLVSSEDINTFCTTSLYTGGSRQAPSREALSSSKVLQNLSSKSTLGFPFPNPVGESCNIDFELFEACGYRIALTNILGQEIKVIDEHVLSQSGKFNILFETSNLDSGIYFITFDTGGLRQSRKLAVVK